MHPFVKSQGMVNVYLLPAQSFPVVLPLNVSSPWLSAHSSHNYATFNRGSLLPEEEFKFFGSSSEELAILKMFKLLFCILPVLKMFFTSLEKLSLLLQTKLEYPIFSKPYLAQVPCTVSLCPPPFIII